MNALRKSKDLPIGTVMEHYSGNRVVLRRRKEAGEGHLRGWWVDGGGGLADRVIDAEDSEWHVADCGVETPEAAVEAVARRIHDAMPDGYTLAMARHHAERAIDALRAQGWTPPGTEDAK